MTKEEQTLNGFSEMMKGLCNNQNLEVPNLDKDAISRKAVFEAIDDCNSDGLKGIFCSYADGERFKKYVKELPPITPTHKAGKWIKYGVPRCGEQHYQCTYCKEYFNFGLYSDYYLKAFKYCPNCSAKMEVE